MAILYIGLNSVKKMDKTATKVLLICLADFRLALARRPTSFNRCAPQAWLGAVHTLIGFTKRIKF